MRIRALRVREVGCFREGQALEGLSGRLDVLAGPNELGKSTLLRALGAVFTEKHTTRAKGLADALRPYQGGAPLIEVEFETDAGAAWRLRKQFFQSNSAELISADGRQIHRGADVDDALKALVDSGPALPAPLGLFWVPQKASLADLAPEREEGLSIRHLIGREIDSVAEGEAARAVREEVARQIAQHATAGRGQATGRYKEALAERQRLAAALALAERQLAEAGERLDRLGRLRDERRLLDAEAAAGSDRAAAETARRQVEEARAAESALQTAEAELARAEAEHSTAQRALERYTALAVEHGRLAAGLCEDAAEAARQEDMRLRAEAARTSARSRGEAMEARAGDLQRVLSEAHRQAAALRAAADLKELEARRQQGEALSEAIAAGRAALEKEALDDQLLRRIEAEARAITLIDERLAAGAPLVRFEIAETARGLVSVGGHGIPASGEVRPTGPVAIEIAGIGRIVIAPARPDGVDDLEADRSAHGEVLAGLLGRAGAKDLADARDRHVDVAARRRRLAEDEARLGAIAPEGLVALKARIAALVKAGYGGPVETAAQAGLSGADAVEEVERELAELLKERSRARQEADEAGEAERAASLALGRIAERRQRSEERMAAIAAEIGQTGEGERARLESLTAACAADLADRVRSRDTWRRAVPDAAARRAIDARLAAADGRLQGLAARISENERAMAAVAAALERDDQDDVAERVEGLKSEYRGVCREIARIERELAMLRMLAADFDAVRQEWRSRLDQPVVARLEPYLAMVLPEATIRLGPDALVPAGLVRAGREEALTRLSEGTREQIAILVRLGFARLYAERGHALPVILDDALVYSDDARIEKMFDALERAAGLHQVIVLTCRLKAFERLGGTRLSLVPWRPD
ncbi:MAG: hypothetical protein R3D33_16835 [Hyphomicrobiaceae bacterium]